MASTWPIRCAGKWYVWKPLPGLDPMLNEAAMWLGAAEYAAARARGKPEAVSQTLAEQAAYEATYRIRYSISGK